jgi:hypothetical protein
MEENFGDLTALSFTTQISISHLSGPILKKYTDQVWDHEKVCETNLSVYFEV